MDITELMKAIKSSKKYKAISEDVIKQKIEEYTKKNPRWQEYKDKHILKEIKRILHKAHGSFQINAGKAKLKQELLEELRKDPDDLDAIDDILKTNRSTRERLGIYQEVYKKIFDITGEPRSILDLGAGLNPVSFAYMDLNEDPDYYAYDINEKDAEFLNEFFKIEKINGKAESLDLSRAENIANLPNADICLMFKLVDTLEMDKKGHKYSEEIIQTLAQKCEFVVASFATRTVSGKSMNFPQRGWIERMLTRIGMKYRMLEFDSEIFYVISK